MHQLTLVSNFRMASPAQTSLFSVFENGLRSFGTDPFSVLKNIDFKTVGLVGVGILIAVLIIDLIGYLIAGYQGKAGDFVPYSRSLAVMAADAWENRQDNYIGEVYDPYARAR